MKGHRFLDKLRVKLQQKELEIEKSKQNLKVFIKRQNDAGVKKDLIEQINKIDAEI